MPKLPKKTQDSVEKAEEWGESSYLLDEGRYAAQLQGVESREGAKGEYWSWVYTNLHDQEGTPHPGRQWDNTSLSQPGRLKQVFNAFGYSTDSDTDEMIGEWVTLVVRQEVAQAGKRAGQLVNRVSSIAEFDPAEFDFDYEAASQDLGAEASF